MRETTAILEVAVASGKTSSPLRLSARKERAFELFAQGARVIDVARDVEVAWDTAKRYKDAYDDMITSQAQDNPDVLLDVVGNTFRMLVELDQARQEAWDRYRRARSDAARVSFLNLAVKIQSDRAKLFGLLGVKPEYAARVEKIRVTQGRLIEFMSTELCDVDREKLISYLQESVHGTLEELPTAPEVVYEPTP